MFKLDLHLYEEKLKVKSSDGLLSNGLIEFNWIFSD